MALPTVQVFVPDGTLVQEMTVTTDTVLVFRLPAKMSDEVYLAFTAQLDRLATALDAKAALILTDEPRPSGKPKH